MALIDEFNLSADAVFQHRVLQAFLSYALQTVAAEVTNDQQTIAITGGPTGGSFTLGGGPLTGAVAPAWNVTAQGLASALAAQLAAGNTCVCTGGPLPGTGILVTWTGGLAFSPQNILTLNANNLTGGSSPNVTITHTTIGVAAVNHTLRATLAKQLLASPSSYLYLAANIATDATVIADYTGGGSVQSAVTDAHINAAVASQFNAIAGAI
jgi:hypothetical protein